MPNFTNRTVWQSLTGTVGAPVEGSVPNITGRIYNNQNIYQDIFDSGLMSGALYIESDEIARSAIANTDMYKNNILGFGINASRSSEAYGRYSGDIVVPTSNCVSFCIRY